MPQIKEKKNKYRNADKKMKAALHRRSFHLDSEIYEKPMNLTMKIIQRNERKLKFFSGGEEVKIYGFE